ncbi:MAG: YabP/YqfC family sporulation protein [bacterium]
MNLINNIKNFLYDKEYFVSMYEEHIHLYGYNQIIKFDESELIFDFTKFKLNIKGEKLLVKKMLSNEMLISGIIKSFEIENEKTNMG